MAKPIKETPVLKGRDAERFHKELRNSNNRKVSPDVRERMNHNFDIMRRIARF